MTNKKVILAIAAGVAITAAIIAWLVFGSKPVEVETGNGVTAQINATLKNTVVKREQNGKLLWEFKVGELENDHVKKIGYLNGINGKIYRSDGSYIDVKADKGSAKLDMNDFALEGKVVAVLNTGGKISADNISWNQKDELITAEGNVEFYKGEWMAKADYAETTSAFEKLKLKGHAKVEKGGEYNDK